MLRSYFGLVICYRLLIQLFLFKEIQLIAFGLLQMSKLNNNMLNRLQMFDIQFLEDCHCWQDRFINEAQSNNREIQSA